MITRVLSGISRYSGFWSGIYCRLRLLTCPFGRISEFVPARGRILDLGCGAGVFSFLLSVSLPSRQIIAMDCRAERLRSSARVAEENGFGALSFVQGDILSFPYPGPADCILLVDVLYQLPFEQKTAVIRKCYETLANDGVLLVKETDAGPGWKALFCYLQEMMLARLIKLNRGRVEPLACAAWMKLLAEEGFSAVMRRIDKGYPYPHVLFVCRKTERG